MSHCLFCLTLIVFIGHAAGQVINDYRFNAVSTKVGPRKKESLCSLSGCESSKVSNTSVLFNTCHKSNSYLKGRCCVNKGSSLVIGIDLSHCALTDVGVLSNADKTTEGYDRKEVQMLLLDDNPLSDCDEQVFSGMDSLEYLSLPSVCSCPFGNNTWDSEKHLFNETICTGDKCRKSGVTCPSNSHCKVHSRDVFWCICNEGYHGYKCLRKGSFPLYGFIGGILGATASLSGVFWLLSRRKAQKLE